jgi:hypothetical protein
LGAAAGVLELRVILFAFYISSCYISIRYIE